MKAIELFSCSGGMAEGFRRAGIDFDLAFDADPDACESYAANLGRQPVRMDVRDLLRLVEGGWRPLDGLDLLVADPPCTPWSRAGKRQGVRDPRDMLRVTVELIALLRPRAYLIGNIPGLDDANNLPIVQDLIGGLAKHGYCAADFARLDAADFGVPQHRVRPFWFGHLGGPCIRWPLPTHGDPELLRSALPGVNGLEPWVTCRDALQHLPVEELGRPIRLRKRTCHSDQHGSLAEKPARVVGTSNLSDGNVLLAPRRHWHNQHPPSEPDSPARTITTRQRSGHGGGAALLTNDRHPLSTPDAPAYTIGGGRANRGAQGGMALRVPDPNRPIADVGSPHRTFVSASKDTALLPWPWDRPSTTVTPRNSIGPPGHHVENSVWSDGAIVLSERAAAILQGFPESWVFCGRTKRARWSQLGQAMPPALAAAVARAVRSWLESRESAA